MAKKELKSLVLVGRVLAPVGLRGEVRVEVASDVPQRFAHDALVYIGGVAHRIQRSRSARQGLVLKLTKVDSRAQAEALRDKALEVPQAEVPTPPQGSYYYFQVLDMEVFTKEGEYLGKVTEILPTGSNDVYVVRKEEKETLVPALEGVVVDVDVEARRMRVSLPEGLRG